MKDYHLKHYHFFHFFFKIGIISFFILIIIFSFNIIFSLFYFNIYKFQFDLKRKKIKKFIEENLIKYFDDVDSFTKFILEKLGFLSPYDLQNKLKYVLEENTEVSIYLHLIFISL